jgi:hypothetical protein
VNPKYLITDLRDCCGVDCERIGELIGLSGSYVRSLASGRRERIAYEPMHKLLDLHAEMMARVPLGTRILFTRRR